MQAEEADHKKDGYVVRRVLIDGGDGSYWKKARELILWMTQPRAQTKGRSRRMRSRAS